MRGFRLLLLLPLLAGCGDRSAMPYLGKWSGGLDVQSVEKGAAVADPERNRLKGYLQLYATEHRYELHLEGEQFAVTVGGSWSSKEGRIKLEPKEVKIDDGGGEEARNPNRAWIEPKDLNAFYSRPMSFRVSKDGQKLTGLLDAVGPLKGTHSFLREGSGH